MRRFGQQRRRRHDLTGLTIATLHNLQVDPCLLHPGSDRGCADSLDGGDLAVADTAYWQHTRAHRLAVQMDRTGSALGDTATELCASQAERVAQRPQQGCVGWDVDVAKLPVYLECDHENTPASFGRGFRPAPGQSRPESSCPDTRACCPVSRIPEESPCRRPCACASRHPAVGRAWPPCFPPDDRDWWSREARP